MKVTSLVLKGYDQTDTFTEAASSELLSLKKSIVVTGRMRGIAGQQQVALDPNDVVELVFEDDTTGSAGPIRLMKCFPK
ncbi:hypothetical protein MKQ70_15990 [Chitinophaga sedimenti]|uniref:hypothetical protein n=1 Tax=Chitinophaga sedimenti TaxID=2033606 RepID=UPI002005054D|nr:hypothetical protein [Chitinophaga sedimenti]MCK7556435.1 hypothetical protein [Chitinophaga sedimenti]